MLGAWKEERKLFPIVEERLVCAKNISQDKIRGEAQSSTFHKNNDRGRLAMFLL